MGRGVHISDHIARLRAKDGQLIGVSRDETDAAPQPIPLEDLDIAVIDSTLGIFLDTHVLEACARSGTSIVVTDPSHMPIGAFVPFAPTLDHARLTELQCAMSQPRRKRLWQAIVRAKIQNQLENLPDVYERNRLLDLANKVSSGDKTNNEAQAARLYWQALIGQDFRRDPKHDVGLNAALNFSYAVLRSILARSVVLSGLHPGIPLFHSNRVNPFALVDDLMEPFRPLADRFVLTANVGVESRLSSEIRHHLAGLMGATIVLDGLNGPLAEVADRYVAGIKRYLTSDIGVPPMPIIERQRG